MKEVFQNRERRGVALMMVLGAIALMSLALVGVMGLIQSDLEEQAIQNKIQRAELLAQSGLAIGIHPQIGPDDPLLKQTFPNGERFEVEMLSEGGKLNINFILRSGFKGPLTRLFESWGVEHRVAQGIVDCLQDWVDPDELKRLNGAERADYEAERCGVVPSNRAFASIDEMALVKGMDIVIEKRPDWREAFTVWSEGPLDVNEADSASIAVMAEVEIARADTLVRFRSPKSEKPEEPPKKNLIQSMDQARQLLGLPENEFQKVAPRFMLKSMVQRLTSRGEVSGVRRTIKVVARRDIVPVQWLSWEE